MTDEEIDKLEGQELDIVFAEAFGTRAPSSTLRFCISLDRVLAALPDEWVWIAGKRFTIKGKEPDATKAYWTEVYAESRLAPNVAFGPTPATALCRAALKVKAEADDAWHRNVQRRGG